MKALIDTSVVLALGRGESLSLQVEPEAGSISAVTLCGLHHGVLVADEAKRAGRLAMLGWAERTFDVLPVDDAVAPHYGRIMASARSKLGARPRMADALIAATAVAHGLTVLTRDRDFERMPGVDVVVV